MKKTFKRIVCLLLILVTFAAMIPSASAASTKAEGFPLPVKGSPYGVNVLERYSGGSTHESYIYNREYGPLKGRTPDPLIVMDIAVALNTEVYAVAAGKIKTVAYGNNGGYYVVIAHDDGNFSYYGHLAKKCTLKVGTRVAAGQLIGYSGNTGGKSTGPHLHFEWSGHDPFCEYSARGLVKINANSGASKYPHNHGVKVTLNANGGSVSASSVSVQKGGAYGNLPVPQRSGYTFKGWYTKSSGGSKISATTTLISSSDHSIYAQWSKCSHQLSGGICKNCGYEKPWTVKSMNPTAYKITKSGSAPLWNRPYSTNSTQVDRAAKDGIVVAVGKTVNDAGNTWYLLSDGSWVYSGNVKKVSMPKNLRYVNAPDGLNIRSSASTSGKKLDTIPDGGCVIINPSKISSNWVYVEYGVGGISGWVSSKYLSTKP